MRKDWGRFLTFYIVRSCSFVKNNCQSLICLLAERIFLPLVVDCDRSNIILVTDLKELHRCFVRLNSSSLKSLSVLEFARNCVFLASQRLKFQFLESNQWNCDNPTTLQSIAHHDSLIHSTFCADHLTSNRIFHSWSSTQSKFQLWKLYSVQFFVSAHFSAA